MNGHAVPDIPRLYTALAEWLSCGLFVLLLRPRIKKLKLAAFSAIYLLLLALFLQLTATVKLWLWIPCMLLAFSSIVVFIRLCNKTTVTESVYYAAMAFSVAECIASIEWQAVNTLFPNIEAMPIWAEVLAIVLVYGVSLFAIWKLLKPRFYTDKRMIIEKKDWLTALFICIVVFVFSNMNFISISSSVQGQYFKEIAYTRTFVDIAGVSMLYAQMLSCHNNMVQRELDAVQSTLKNHYVQYKQSKESIDIINIKYHDMKHQINMLREMEDSDQRAALLDRMEEDIKTYELQNKTGNSILDTVLTGKSIQCHKHGITMTVVANGKLLDFMDAMDICAIFGNALDNAIEAVIQIKEKEKRLIHVTVSQFKSFVMIHIENCYETILKMDNGNYVTTKENEKNHGYGIKSIIYSAERYGGVVNIRNNDNWFELKILIPINNKH